MLFKTSGLVASMFGAFVLTTATIVFEDAPAYAGDEETRLNIVASIAPIARLAKAVVGDQAKVHTIVGPNASPHGFSLKPSDATALQEADFVLWVASTLEGFLVKPVESLGTKAVSLQMSQVEGVEVLEIRDSEAFEHDHDHGDDNGHDDHADHSQEATHDDHGHDHDHDHDKEAKAEGHNDHAGHAHGSSIDEHIWLNPDNAIAFVRKLTAELSEANPESAAEFADNAEREIASIEKVRADLTATLAPLDGKNFIVFHDAYQYFEKSFGLSASGAVAVNPEVPLGAARLKEVRETIVAANAECVFAEPQFSDASINAVISGLDVGVGVLDPVGIGEMTYAEHLQKLGEEFASCFK